MGEDSSFFHSRKSSADRMRYFPKEAPATKKNGVWRHQQLSGYSLPDFFPRRIALSSYEPEKRHENSCKEV